jgi:hypothetical protein
MAGSEVRSLYRLSYGRPGAADGIRTRDPSFVITDALGLGPPPAGPSRGCFRFVVFRLPAGPWPPGRIERGDGIRLRRSTRLSYGRLSPPDGIRTRDLLLPKDNGSQGARPTRAAADERRERRWGASLRVKTQRQGARPSRAWPRGPAFLLLGLRSGSGKHRSGMSVVRRRDAPQAALSRTTTSPRSWRATGFWTNSTPS